MRIKYHVSNVYVVHKQPLGKPGECVRSIGKHMTMQTFQHIISYNVYI